MRTARKITTWRGVPVSTCTKCNQLKPLDGFGKSRWGLGGLRSMCKYCHVKAATAWAAANRERALKLKRKWYSENKGLARKQNREWRLANSGRNAELTERWRKRYPAKALFISAVRRARKRMAFPRWADKLKMLRFYELSQKLTEETGIRHHVDHVIPLKHRLVCGLHCEFNLQIISQMENCKKYNHWNPAQVGN